MFLMIVHMTVTNMRYAHQVIPGVLDTHPINYHLDTFASDAHDFPYTDPVTEGDNLNTKDNANDDNNLIEIAENQILDKVEMLSDPKGSKETIKGGNSNVTKTTSDGSTMTENKGNRVSETPSERTKKENIVDDPPKPQSNLAKHNANKSAIVDEPKGSVSTPVSQLPSLLATIPNDNNTAITLVAMGGLVDTFLAERCIRSIRQRGKFFGPIMLFTDGDSHKRFQETIPFMDNRTIIIQGRDEDLYPREKNETLKKYAQRSMVFKRFKTHHSKYIEADPNLSDSIRFVVYVDVDNIIGSPMDIFFQEYTKMVADRYPRAMDFHRNFTSTQKSATDKSKKNDGFGFMGMFRDRHLKSKMHGGILLYDRAFETQCVNAWRNEMDTYWDSSDQIMFLRVLGDYDRYQCTVFDLPRDRMNFATKGIMRDAMEERLGKRPKRYKPIQFPTFIHVTAYRVKRLNNATIHNEFVRHLLHLKGNESITDKISWEDVVSPSASRTTKK